MSKQAVVPSFKVKTGMIQNPLLCTYSSTCSYTESDVFITECITSYHAHKALTDLAS